MRDSAGNRLGTRCRAEKQILRTRHVTDRSLSDRKKALFCRLDAVYFTRDGGWLCLKCGKRNCVYDSWGEALSSSFSPTRQSPNAEAWIRNEAGGGAVSCRRRGRQKSRLVHRSVKITRSPWRLDRRLDADTVRLEAHIQGAGAGDS